MRAMGRLNQCWGETPFQSFLMVVEVFTHFCLILFIFAPASRFSRSSRYLVSVLHIFVPFCPCLPASSRLSREHFIFVNGFAHCCSFLFPFKFSPTLLIVVEGFAQVSSNLIVISLTSKFLKVFAKLPQAQTFV